MKINTLLTEERALRAMESIKKILIKPQSPEIDDSLDEVLKQGNLKLNIKDAINIKDNEQPSVIDIPKPVSSAVPASRKKHNSKTYFRSMQRPNTHN